VKAGADLAPSRGRHAPTSWPPSERRALYSFDNLINTFDFFTRCPKGAVMLVGEGCARIKRAIAMQEL